MFGSPNRKSSPSKRKPFVSTAKRVSTLGVPPPLPPVAAPSSAPPTPQQDDRKSLEDIPVELAIPTVNETLNSLSPSNILVYQQQTARWLNLSTTLWSMIVNTLFLVGAIYLLNASFVIVRLRN
jgi:hypothetical protein